MRIHGGLERPYIQSAADCTVPDPPDALYARVRPWRPAGLARLTAAMIAGNPAHPGSVPSPTLRLALQPCPGEYRIA